MNYKYLIALFAGDEVDAWEAPKSAWIIIKNFDDTAWSNEFCSIKGLQEDTDDVHMTFHSFVNISHVPSESELRIYASGNSDPHDDYRYYYNEDKDKFFYLTKEEYAALGDKLDMLLEYVENSEVEKTVLLSDVGIKL